MTSKTNTAALIDLTWSVGASQRFRSDFSQPQSKNLERSRKHILMILAYFDERSEDLSVIARQGSGDRESELDRIVLD
jgi:hypothetical protein